MNLYEYIQEYYNNNPLWFTEEVKQSWHINRIGRVLGYKSYLKGNHKVLQRENAQYKGKEYVTRKIVLQTAKTILNFHSTYLLGKPVSLVGSEDMVREFNKIYRQGNYNNTDFKIADKVNKFGDVYEYVYINDGKVRSKLINSEDGYPIYNDEGDYIGFIEYYIVDSVSHYTVFYFDHVEKWTDAGGELHKVEEYINVSGLPIHYRNINDFDEDFGRSELEDIIPILDEMEDILSKFADAIYTNSLNPMPVVSGQRIDSQIPADAIGYILNLEESGEFEVVSTTLDYQSIKLLYDNLKQALLDVAGMPSVAMGQGNVANVSEVSLKLLYQMADVKAMLNEKWLREGLRERFDIIRRLLDKAGVRFSDEDYIDVELNYSRPVNTSDIIENLKKQREMGAISVRSIIDKSPLTNDIEQEIERLREEGRE